MTEFNSIKEILDSCGRYSGLTMGCSMWPMIHQQRDTIIVVKNKGRLKKYDVPVYLYPPEKYVMHRIIQVHDDYYTIVGDNLLKREKITDDMICGVLIGYYKGGKKYIDCENNKWYRLYAKIWVALLPIRPVIMFFHKIYWWIKRRLFK